MSDTPKKTQPYRPSNGSEFEVFDSQFCGRCIHDHAARGNPDSEEGCPILAASFLYAIGDQQYPAQWVRDVDSPFGLIGGTGARCTAFVEWVEPDGDGEIPPRSTAARIKSMAELKAYLASEEAQRGKSL